MEPKETAGQDERPVRKLPIIIKLAKPINTGEGEITELVLKREPNGADWGPFNVQNPQISDFQRVASKISDVPLPFIRKMDTKATFELVEAVSGFLG